MKELIVIGGGGFAKEVVWLARDCGRTVRGILDDTSDLHGKKVFGVDVLGPTSSWTDYECCEFIVAVGTPRIRQKIISKMEERGFPEFATLVHPSVLQSSAVEIGKGTIICAGTILTTDIKIGDHNIINLNVTVGHECLFGHYVTVAPMAAISGNVTLNHLVEVGTGALVKQGLELSEGSMLGMGGVLTKSIIEPAIFAGNPARKLKDIVE